MRFNVHVLDEDDHARHAIASLLKLHGWAVHLHRNESDYLQRRQRNVPSCLIMEMRLPGGDGLEFQNKLQRSEESPSVIILTAHGTIPAVVKAMKQGAIDFLSKPISSANLLAAVQHAFDSEAARLKMQEDARIRQAQFASLTAREQEIFLLIATGHMNKHVAQLLGITEGTVKVHRRHLTRKFFTSNITDLVRIADLLGVGAPHAMRPSGTRSIK